MSQEFHAIYEHGILSPLTPLNLSESAEVSGFLQQKNGSAEGISDDSLIGLMADEPELVDAIVEEAMFARESYSFRTNS